MAEVILITNDVFSISRERGFYRSLSSSMTILKTYRNPWRVVFLLLECSTIHIFTFETLQRGFQFIISHNTKQRKIKSPFTGKLWMTVSTTWWIKRTLKFLQLPYKIFQFQECLSELHYHISFTFGFIQRIKKKRHITTGHCVDILWVLVSKLGGKNAPRIRFCVIFFRTSNQVLLYYLKNRPRLLAITPLSL